MKRRSYLFGCERFIVVVIAAMFCAAGAAQDYYDDYYYDDYSSYSGDDYEYIPCLHSSNVEAYSIVRYREGMQDWVQSLAIQGTVMMSSTCIEIQSGRIEMEFVIAEIERKQNTPRYYRFYRQNADDSCDFMEMREGFGRDRGLFYLMFGNLDREKDTMTNTQQLVIKPLKMKIIK